MIMMKKQEFCAQVEMEGQGDWELELASMSTFKATIMVLLLDITISSFVFSCLIGPIWAVTYAFGCTRRYNPC